MRTKLLMVTLTVLISVTFALTQPFHFSVSGKNPTIPPAVQPGGCGSFSDVTQSCAGGACSNGSITYSGTYNGSGINGISYESVQCSGAPCDPEVWPIAHFNGYCCDQDHDNYSSAACGGSDCNDGDYYINPGVAEVCEDGVDNDCQGGDACCDDDGDGVCNSADCAPNNSSAAYDNDHDGYCEDVDCNDYDPSVHPGASITNCNSAGDVNCNGHEDALDCIGSPVVVDVAGDGINLTDNAGGVNFDLDGDGGAEIISWTRAGTDDAWLALDRNGNGAVDSGAELFGDFTPQPTPPQGTEKNGFLALAEHDKPQQGGNGDGTIDSRDAVFTSLRLWQDTNHNGISEANELNALAALGLQSVDLKYKESKRTDEYGNQFRYRAKVGDVHGARFARWAWDVFLQRAPSQSAQTQTRDSSTALFAPARLNNLSGPFLRPLIASACQFKPVGITAGATVPVAGINWRQNRQTLLLVLRSGCHFCADSAAFYQRLAIERGIEANAKLVAVLPGEVDDSKKYLDHLGVPIKEVRRAGLGALGVQGTPTLLLVNDKGVVTHAWRGQLSAQKEEEVINTLRGEGR